MNSPTPSHTKKIVPAALLSILFVALPLAVFAAGVSTDTSGSSTGTYCPTFTGSITLASSTVTDVIKFITCFLLKAIIPLLFALALAAFIYGVFDFIRASASGEETGKKKEFMVWGIVALCVMFSVWGLVSIFQGTFKIGNVIPQLPVNSQ